jgi:hypothetical protein
MKDADETALVQRRDRFWNWSFWTSLALCEVLGLILTYKT